MARRRKQVQVQGENESVVEDLEPQLSEEDLAEIAAAVEEATVMDDDIVPEDLNDENGEIDLDFQIEIDEPADDDVQTVLEGFEGLIDEIERDVKAPSGKKERKKREESRRYTADQVRVMRQMRWDGEKYSVIARNFGCSNMCVRNIVMYNIYSDVDPERDPRNHPDVRNEMAKREKELKEQNRVAAQNRQANKAKSAAGTETAAAE